MIKRLFSTEVTKAFADSNIDKTHSFANTQRIIQLAQKIFEGTSAQNDKNLNININIQNNQTNNININIENNLGLKSKSKSSQKRQELIKIIQKKIMGPSQTERIKTLVVLHAVLQKTNDKIFMNSMLDILDEYIVPANDKRYHLDTQMFEQGKKQCKVQNRHEQFIQKHIVSFYCQYLKKYILSMETYRYAQAFLKGRFKEANGTIQLINKSFIILNMVNYILESQYTFNKMGRYYLQHNQILNVFVNYLKDLILYNGFIKEVVKNLIKSIKNSQKQQIKHHFLFITEAQKTSDRLYEFFYNRYYYSKAKKLIHFPTFLIIKIQQFKQLASLVKKEDKNLFSLVQKSKYQKSQGRGRSRTVQTQGDELNPRFNRTQMSLSLDKSDFLNSSHHIKGSEPVFHDLDEIQLEKYVIFDK